jgi:molecular chaperone DnaK (HSP70)
VQKKTSTKLQFKNSSYALAPKTRQQYHELENRIAADDQNILDLKEIKNSLESYGYDMRQKIDQYGDLEKYVDDLTKAAFIKDINETVEWLYEDASKTATKDQLQNKLFVFKTLGEPIKRRQAYYSELEVYFNQFEKICEGIQK